MFNYCFFLRNNLISLFTLTRKECIRILRIWPQTILPPTITVILYYLIFGNLMGKRIGYMVGYDYTQYIIPGLIIMSIITTSYSNVVSSFFGSKFQKNIEEILISPTYNSVIICGFIFGGIVRSFFVCILNFFISSFFCDIYFYNFFMVFLVYIFTTILFSLLGLINGIFAKKFDDISIIPTFLLTPLIYLGGVFYSIDLLPEQLRFLVFLNPIFYIINIFRYGVLGISEVDVFFSFIIMFVIIIIFFIISLSLINIGYQLKK